MKPPIAPKDSRALEVVVESLRTELREVPCLHQVASYINTQMTLACVAVGQRVVAVLVSSQLEKSIGASVDQDVNQLRIAACPEVGQDSRQISPVAHCQPSAKAGDEVSIQVEVGVMGVEDVGDAVRLCEGLRRTSRHQVAQPVPGPPT